MADQPTLPYVIFEYRPVEDREASLASGHYIAKDVAYAIITPAGSRDRVEKVAEDWIRDMEEGVRQERIPQSWPRLYREALVGWTKNQQNPEFGTPIRDWAGASPAQVKMLLEVGLVSVEHVAEMTEEALSRIGMGGRALKSKAQAWLDSAKGIGQTAGELEALRQANADLIARAEAAEAASKSLETRLAALEKSLEKAK